MVAKIKYSLKACFENVNILESLFLIHGIIKLPDAMLCHDKPNKTKCAASNLIKIFLPVFVNSVYLY